MNFELNEEQRMWRNVVHDFVDKEVKPKAAELSEAHELNWPAIKKMGMVDNFSNCSFDNFLFQMVQNGKGEKIF